MVKEVKSWREEKRRKVWESNTQSNKITQPWWAFYVLSVVPCTTESQSYHQVFHLPDTKSIMRTVSIFIEILAPKVTPSNLSQVSRSHPLANLWLATPPANPGHLPSTFSYGRGLIVEGGSSQQPPPSAWCPWRNTRPSAAPPPQLKDWFSVESCQDVTPNRTSGSYQINLKTSECWRQGKLTNICLRYAFD